MRLLLAFACVLCLFSFALQAADSKVAGKWEWTATPSEGDSVTGTLEVKEDGGKLSGSLIPHEGDPSPMVDPKLEGDTFTFSVNVGGNDYQISVTVSGDKFTGKFKGDAASGTIEGSRKG